MAQFGSSTQGLPALEVSRGTDGELVINNGVTRAMRVAKLAPGKLIFVEVIDDLPISVAFLQLETDPTSIRAADELLEAISELRELFPDWRVGQLVANLVTAAGGADASAIWNVEDRELLVAARRLIERNRDRRVHGDSNTAS